MYSPECAEGVVHELRVYGVLRSSCSVIFYLFELHALQLQPEGAFRERLVEGAFGAYLESGSPELADDERFSTHLARGERQEELEGIVADWAGKHDAEEIDRTLNEAGVICGPIYTIADIFEDEHFRAREMLVEHEDPEFGTYLGPGIVPKFSETPGRVRWSATWQPGSHNREVYCDLLGLSDETLAELEEEGVL